MHKTLNALCLLAVVAGCDPDVNETCPVVVRPGLTLGLVAPPFQQIHRGAVRMRFEARELAGAPISFEPEGAPCISLVNPEEDRQTREWAFPADPSTVELPDESGDYVLYTARIDAADVGLPPGERVPYTVHAGETEAGDFLGTTRAVPQAGESASVLLTGSLAPPVQADVLGLVPDVDLVVLAGDLRRGGVDSSTWRQLAADVYANQPGAYVHAAVGDLEDVEETSRDQVFLRWFEDQGRPGGTDRYYAFDMAGIRFIVLDAEDDRLGIDGSLQWRWLEKELTDVATEEGLREAIVIMHKGPHGLTEQVPSADLRDELLPKLREAGVRIVFSGHGHGYQRFDDGGLAVIDDGGGGAELGNLDHRLERDPDGAAKRVAQSATHGATHLTIGEDGGLVVRRVGVDGSEVDRLELAPPAVGE